MNQSKLNDGLHREHGQRVVDDLTRQIRLAVALRENVARFYGLRDEDGEAMQAAAIIAPPWPGLADFEGEEPLKIRIAARDMAAARKVLEKMERVKREGAISQETNTQEPKSQYPNTQEPSTDDQARNAAVMREPEREAVGRGQAWKRIEPAKLKAVGSLPEPFTRAAVAVGIGCDSKAASDLLNRMKGKGWVEQPKHGLWQRTKAWGQE